VTDVPFPAVSKEGPSSEGVVSTWFVGDGDSVREGQLIAEVQVDKVSAEVPAPVAGTVRLLVQEEAVVKQGDLIARIE
jgi:pyruvate/2-oxoglutarate dehydrogenase complex dihydrolipoamide acyltransferase (E2) component